MLENRKNCSTVTYFSRHTCWLPGKRSCRASRRTTKKNVLPPHAPVVEKSWLRHWHQVRPTACNITPYQDCSLGASYPLQIQLPELSHSKIAQANRSSRTGRLHFDLIRWQFYLSFRLHHRILQYADVHNVCSSVSALYLNHRRSGSLAFMFCSINIFAKWCVPVNTAHYAADTVTFTL